MDIWSILKIAGAVVFAIFVFYALKEIGFFDLLKKILEFAVSVALISLGAAFAVSLFGVDFKMAFFWACPIIAVLLLVIDLGSKKSD